jgi:ribonuclease R
MLTTRSNTQNEYKTSSSKKKKKGKGTPRRGSTRKDDVRARKSSGVLEREREETKQGNPHLRFQVPIRKAQAAQLVEGRIDLHPDGFAFLIPHDPKLPNIYVGKDSLKGVMHRDEVRIQISQSFQDGKMRGSVLEILRRHQKEFIGVYRPHKGGVLLVPLEARDRNHVFKLDPKAPVPESLKPGATVLCRILEYPSKLPGVAQIVSAIEDPKSPSIDSLRVLLDVSWPHEFTRVSLAEAENRALRWKEFLSPSRKDIRHLPLVTIDGRDARDFDDAVCAALEPNANIRLWVAIADVSLFVKPGTALDREAYERSTSVYLPDHVVPMLPEILSNGVCSLNPFEERPCLVCECVIDRKGMVVSYEFYEGLMQSKRRLTYEQMQGFMEKETWALNELQPLSESLNNLVEVFERLHQARLRRGAIDLEIPEAQVILNSDGSVLDIQPRTRLNAHRLIEECMLIANHCAAKFLHKKCKAGVYRIHEEPDVRKAREFVQFLSLQGINVIKVLGKKWERRQKQSHGKKNGDSEGDSPLTHPMDYSTLLRRLKKEFSEEDPLVRALQPMMLRTLKQARYSTQRKGHFALADMDYTHFTSPIRRYPDLMVHRLIKEGLGLKDAFDPSTDLETRCQYCSDAERTAMEAERKLIEIKKCRYMEPRIGQEFEAWVSGVTEKGLFCQIEGHFVDGLMSAEILARWGAYTYDAQHMCYRSSGGKILHLGHRMRLRLIGVDVGNRKIDFEPLELIR